MVKVKFNKDYQDKKLDRLIKAQEIVDVTVTRANEIVKNVKKDAAERFPAADYSNFNYERLDKKETAEKSDA